jgi:hypothetical protein
MSQAHALMGEEGDWMKDFAIRKFSSDGGCRIVAFTEVGILVLNWQLEMRCLLSGGATC